MSNVTNVVTDSTIGIIFVHGSIGPIGYDADEYTVEAAKADYERECSRYFFERECTSRFGHS